MPSIFPENQVYQPVTHDELHELMVRLQSEGWRLAQISVTVKEKLDVIYSLSYDADPQELLNLRLEHERGTVLQSISDIFPYAFLYENEMHDLFGIDIEGINLDFHGEFYKLAKKTPFAGDAAQPAAGKQENT